MRGKELQQALTSGQPVYGTCLVGYGQPVWPKMFAQTGLDFVFFGQRTHPPKSGNHGLGGPGLCGQRRGAAAAHSRALPHLCGYGPGSGGARHHRALG